MVLLRTQAHEYVGYCGYRITDSTHGDPHVGINADATAIVHAALAPKFR